MTKEERLEKIKQFKKAVNLGNKEVDEGEIIRLGKELGYRQLDLKDQGAMLYLANLDSAILDGKSISRAGEHTLLKHAPFLLNEETRREIHDQQLLRGEVAADSASYSQSAPSAGSSSAQGQDNDIPTMTKEERLEKIKQFKKAVNLGNKEVDEGEIIRLGKELGYRQLDLKDQGAMLYLANLDSAILDGKSISRAGEHTLFKHAPFLLNDETRREIHDQLDYDNKLVENKLVKIRQHINNEDRPFSTKLPISSVSEIRGIIDGELPIEKKLGKIREIASAAASSGSKQFFDKKAADFYQKIVDIIDAKPEAELAPRAGEAGPSGPR